jgi:hypothetical protein
VTPDQMKAARALLGWSRTRLAAWSDTTSHVVTTFEQTGQVAPIRRNSWPEQIDTLAALRGALEEAGVEFTDGAVPGVQLRKSDQ